MFSIHKNNNFAGIKILLYSIVILTISSCVPQRKLIYLQDKDGKDFEKQKEFIREEVKEGTIQPGDELYIRVSSSDEKPTSFSSGQNYGISSDVTLLSYTVDERGSVKLPYIGEIRLNNMSLPEASDTIENLLSQFLYLPSVYIKFVNKNITILGEVRSPGVFTFFDKQISILQAIGYAGDITTFGNRNEVLLIREENGVVKKSTIDLTRSDILTSNLYIIKSNDIIYVQPLSRKKWGMETYPYGLLFSGISMVLMILTFMRYPIY
jgi:polysaccharide export outer membrane protein